MKRTARVSVMLFPKEVDMLKSVSKKLKMPVSAILRDALSLWLINFSTCANEDEYNMLTYRMKI